MKTVMVFLPAFALLLRLPPVAAFGRHTFDLPGDFALHGNCQRQHGNIARQVASAT